MNLGLLLLVMGLGVVAPEQKPAAGPAHVAATVDNEAIGAGEVEREIAPGA